MEDFKQKAKEARLKVLSLIHKAGTSHIGSNLSVVDIFVALQERVDLDKDKIILGAGWKACIFYYLLYKKGRITLKELNSYCIGKSKFIGLAEPVHKDIPAAGGSIGMGLPFAVGFALSKKMKGEEGTVYCIEGDGSLQSGAIWEALLLAAHHKLDNLVILIDNNGLQGMGKTDEILSLGDLVNKLDAFGCYSQEIDGHDFQQLETMFTTIAAPKPESWVKRPYAIVCNTIKGKGVKFMEHNNLWHYLHTDDNDYVRAKKEIQNG